jgi:hypothetical protein
LSCATTAQASNDTIRSDAESTAIDLTICMYIPRHALVAPWQDALRIWLAVTEQRAEPRLMALVLWRHSVWAMR